MLGVRFILLVPLLILSVEAKILYKDDVTLLNPTTDFKACGLSKKAYICNPDRVLSDEEVNRILLAGNGLWKKNCTGDIQIGVYISRHESSASASRWSSVETLNYVQHAFDSWKIDCPLEVLYLCSKWGKLTSCTPYRRKRIDKLYKAVLEEVNSSPDPKLPPYEYIMNLLDHTQKDIHLVRSLVRKPYHTEVKHDWAPSFTTGWIIFYVFMTLAMGAEIKCLIPIWKQGCRMRGYRQPPKNRFEDDEAPPPPPDNTKYPSCLEDILKSDDNLRTYKRLELESKMEIPNLNNKQAIQNPNDETDVNLGKVQQMNAVGNPIAEDDARLRDAADVHVDIDCSRILGSYLQKHRMARSVMTIDSGVECPRDSESKDSESDDAQSVSSDDSVLSNHSENVLLAV